MENTDSIYRQMATNIIKKQTQIIGLNLAIHKARKTGKFLILDDGTVSKVYSNPAQSINELVLEYANLSGQAAVHFSREAIQSLVKENPDLELPEQLRSN